MQNIPNTPLHKQAMEKAISFMLSSKCVAPVPIRIQHSSVERIDWYVRNARPSEWMRGLSSRREFSGTMGHNSLRSRVPLGFDDFRNLRHGNRPKDTFGHKWLRFRKLWALRFGNIDSSQSQASVSKTNIGSPFPGWLVGERMPHAWVFHHCPTFHPMAKNFRFPMVLGCFRFFAANF